MDQPKCRYCETEMVPCNLDDFFPLIPEYWYRCPKCRSTSPVIQHDPRIAYEVARRKNDSPQKPLTLEELKALCETGSHCIYIEHYHANPDIENPITPNVGIKSGRGYRITHCNGYRYKFMWTDYGKTWRAWISMPTDEERASAAWLEV